MPAVPLLVAVVPLCTVVYALARRSAVRKRTADHSLCSIFQLQQRIRGCHSQVDVLLLPLSCCEAERVLAADTTFAAAHVVGLDCEWQPEAASQHSPVSLLQLCAGSKCYLAQLLHMDDVPSQLRYLLENPLVVKVHGFSSPALLLSVLPPFAYQILLEQRLLCRYLAAALSSMLACV